MSVTINGNGSISGYTPTAISGTLSDANMAPGSIIQVKHVKDTTSSAGYQQSTSGAWEDLGSLTLNITPAATSSKILVLAHTCFSETYDYGIWFRVLRDSTPLVGATSGSRTAISFGNTTAGNYLDDKCVSADFSYVDEPSADTQLTYKVQAVSRYSPQQWAFNRSHDSADNASQGQGVSTLTVMEIKG